jgi:pimeloyl-ACP methyl ester carboxylesterase
MPTAQSNGITIAYEDHGDPAAPPILLVMGLGGQLTLWPVELVDALVVRGFRVIRYDNRDVGLSTKFDASGVPNIKWLVLKSVLGWPVTVPYKIADMARDAIGLLDVLGIGQAHIVGASMGGMISQHVAATYPDRVLSLTSIMSTTGNRRLPRAKPEAMRMLANRPASGDPEALVAFGVKAAQVIGGPGYPTDEARLEARVRADHARAWHPAGFARQMAAIIADGDRRTMLKTITAPTLVIHGDADPLVPVEAAHDTVANIAGAKLHIIAHMGHNLPLQLVDMIADAIADHAAPQAVRIAA